MSAGHATTSAHPARIAIIDAIRADRAGPVAVRLLLLSRSDDAFVRREAMDLLSSAGAKRPWPDAAEAALARLTDPDEEVRCRAAYLVVHAGSRNVALRALGELAEPVVRTALAATRRSNTGAAAASPSGATPPAVSRRRLHSLAFKGEVPEGVPAAWVVTAPVACAVAVLEQLKPPGRDFLFSPLPTPSRYQNPERAGRVAGYDTTNKYLAEFVAWTNARAAASTPPSRGRRSRAGRPGRASVRPGSTPSAG
ncbi:hypothetical protein ACFVX6_33285 [Streptomyces sp. NPDC058289]|uniref:hypothetical protein n=1 Tax=Streptomyces sp. NPDC058289 TaxID=3346425 RepID=UPI0036EF8CB4